MGGHTLMEKLVLFPEGRKPESLLVQPDPMVPGAFWSWRQGPSGRRAEIRWCPASQVAPC